jgi:hypothetical protein
MLRSAGNLRDRLMADQTLSSQTNKDNDILRRDAISGYRVGLCTERQPICAT